MYNHICKRLKGECDMSKKLDDALRIKWVEIVNEWLLSIGEEPLRYKANEICIPTLDEEGNERYVQFVVKVPKGSRDGDEFDGYSMKEEYELKLKEKEEKNRLAAERKAKKIAKDKKLREQRKEEKG